MYQYDPEAYRQLHDEKTAQLRSDFQRPQRQRRSNVAERGARFVRSVRLRHKLVTIGVLVAALAVPAGAASAKASACTALACRLRAHRSIPGGHTACAVARSGFATPRPASSKRSRFGSCST